MIFFCINKKEENGAFIFDFDYTNSTLMFCIVLHLQIFPPPIFGLVADMGFGYEKLGIVSFVSVSSP